MRKKDVNWVKDAPQRNCLTCAAIERVAVNPYEFKFQCQKYGWATKAKSICDGFEAKEAPDVD